RRDRPVPRLPARDHPSGRARPDLRDRAGGGRGGGPRGRRGRSARLALEGLERQDPDRRRRLAARRPDRPARTPSISRRARGEVAPAVAQPPLDSVVGGLCWLPPAPAVPVGFAGAPAPPVGFAGLPATPVEPVWPAGPPTSPPRPGLPATPVGS